MNKQKLQELEQMNEDGILLRRTKKAKEIIKNVCSRCHAWKTHANY